MDIQPGPNAQTIQTVGVLLASLRSWFRVYLVSWIAGLALGVAGLVWKMDFATGFGGLLLFVAVVPYFGSIIYAYKIQATLNASGLYKPGAWQVIIGGLILNPWFFGFLIPLSVSSTARKIRLNFSSTSAQVGPQFSNDVNMVNRCPVCGTSTLGPGMKCVRCS